MTDPTALVELHTDLPARIRAALDMMKYGDLHDSCDAYELSPTLLAEALARIEELAHKADRLRAELEKQRRNNEERNKQLDALNFVWCSGGCKGGARRFQGDEVTAEHVAEAERNTVRLRQYYIDRQGLLAEGGTLRDAWDGAKRAVAEEHARRENELIARIEELEAELEEAPAKPWYGDRR